MFAFHVLFWLRVSLCKNTCLVRIFRKCSHHQMCYWMWNYFNTEAYLATFSIIIYLSEIKVMSKHYLGVGVSMRVFLHEVNIWIIGLSEAYCLYQCKWPAQVNISQSTEDWTEHRTEEDWNCHPSACLLKLRCGSFPPFVWELHLYSGSQVFGLRLTYIINFPVSVL